MWLESFESLWDSTFCKKGNLRIHLLLFIHYKGIYGGLPSMQIETMICEANNASILVEVVKGGAQLSETMREHTLQIQYLVR